MDRMSAVLFSLLLITTSLAGCFEDRQKIDDEGIVVENEQVSENETENTTTLDDGFVGSVIFETPGESVLTGVAVPFIYYEDATFYLYMCNGTEGHLNAFSVISFLIIRNYVELMRSLLSFNVIV